MVYCCSVVDIKLCTDFRQCLLTVSADIAWTIWAIQHALDYTIYGRGSAFDVAHKVTIRADSVCVCVSWAEPNISHVRIVGCHANSEFCARVVSITFVVWVPWSCIMDNKDYLGLLLQNMTCLCPAVKSKTIGKHAPVAEAFPEPSHKRLPRILLSHQWMP